MTLSRLLNLGAHVAAGILGIALGLAQLGMRKGGAGHRARGRWYLLGVATVVGTAGIGTFAFRFMPLFAVLTLLTAYLGIGAWRAAQTQHLGPQRIDLLVTVLALTLGAALVPIVLNAPQFGNSRPVVVISTLAALGAVVLYDLLRWCFPRGWFRALWLPEHIYKMLSSLFGMISAFAGNVVPCGQPWSQIAPPAVGTLLIVYFIVRATLHPPPETSARRG